MIKRLILILCILPFLMGARDFDGSTDRIDYTNVLNPAGSAFTLSLWVYPDTVSSTQYLFSINDSGGTRSWSLIWVATASEEGLQFQRIFSGDNFVYRTANILGSGSWQHILVKGDGSTDPDNHSVWLDGTNYGPTTFNIDGTSTETNHTGNWNVGARSQDDAVNFNGRIANIGYWNREVSDSEVAILTEGYEPKCIDRGLVFAPDLIRHQKDQITGQSGSLDGTTVIEHPRTIKCE